MVPPSHGIAQFDAILSRAYQQQGDHWPWQACLWTRQHPRSYPRRRFKSGPATLSTALRRGAVTVAAAAGTALAAVTAAVALEVVVAVMCTRPPATSRASARALWASTQAALLLDGAAACPTTLPQPPLKLRREVRLPSACQVRYARRATRRAIPFGFRHLYSPRPLQPRPRQSTKPRQQPSSTQWRRMSLCWAAAARRAGRMRGLCAAG